MPQFLVSLADDTRVINYDRNMFIIQDIAIKTATKFGQTVAAERSKWQHFL